MRDGKTVHTALSRDLPQEQLIAKMVGRSLDRLFPEPPNRKIGRELLRVENFSGQTLGGRHLFGPISFTLHEGEILGFAGLLGAGRSELLQAIFGDENIITEGNLWIGGEKVNLKGPREGWRKKLSFVAEDRKQDSILAQRSLNENVSLSRLMSQTSLKWLKDQIEWQTSENSLKSLNVKATGPEQTIETLSGGNQQKVIFARALQTGPQVILMDEPTRGVDVGAKYEIYEILFSLAKQGKGILVVSSDLLELMALADRVMVLSAGNFSGELPRSRFSQTEIMKRAIAHV